MIGAIIRTILLSLWLPVTVLAVSFMRFGAGWGGGGGPAMQEVILLFLFTWPAAIPLTAGIQLMHRTYPVLATVCAILLGAASVYGVIIGGLLGPVGIWAYAVILAVPVYFVLLGSRVMYMVKA